MDTATTAAIEGLADAGFDLVHAFDATTAAREPGLDVLAHATLRVGLLVGNTRALWPRFIAAMRDSALAAESDPLDRYTERAIESAFPGAPVYFGHREYGGDTVRADRGSGQSREAGVPALPPERGSARPREGRAFLPFTRLAVATGLGTLAASHLVIHPVYGPWFALRAVILVAGDPPATVLSASSCTCGAPCRTALTAAVGSRSWEAWLAVRDACSRRTWRYSDDQIRYHYTQEWLPPVETP